MIDGKWIEGLGPLLSVAGLLLLLRGLAGSVLVFRRN